MAKISLCLIARDEEQMLPGALESVYGAVDEIIVVDTGSSDKTKEVAKSAGALVVDHFWQDDFSAARNQALSHATGDWILVLDADERLAPGSSTAIREGVEKDSFDCGLLPLFNASRLNATIAEVLEGDAQLGEPVLLPRLFRRSLDLKWEGVVHENVATWLAGEKTIAVLEAPLVHYGATVEARNARDKDRRNLRLLERRCAIEPGDPVARTYLVRELLRAEEGERAHHEVERAWEDLLAAMENVGDSVLRPSVVSTATLRAYLLLTQGRADKAIEILRLARSWGEAHPNFDLLLGNALLATCGSHPSSAVLDEVEEVLRDALNKRGRVYVEEVLPGATSYAARTELGTVFLLRGEVEKAMECFQTALKESSDHEAAKLGRLECMVRLGRVDTALVELDPLLTEKCVDAWVIAALVCARLARVQDTASMLATARSLSGRFLGHHRAHLMSRLNAELHAKSLLNEISGGAISASENTPVEAVRSGEVSFMGGAIEEAQACFMDALDQDIGDTSAWTNLGVTLHTRGRHELAAQSLQVALALEPDDVDARLNLAQVMYALERPHAATECLRGVLERRPDDPMAPELLSLMGVADVEEVVEEVVPQLSVLLRVCELNGLQRTLDWISLQDIEPSAYEVLICAEGISEEVDLYLEETRPYELQVCSSTEEALDFAEGRWVLLLDPNALPAADCFRLHIESHQQVGQSTMVVGAVELAVDSRTTPLLEVMASTSLLDDPMGVMSCVQPRGGSGSCNVSFPLEVLQAVDAGEIWRGGLEVVVQTTLGVKAVVEPAVRVYRELSFDLEGFQTHCFQLGYNHFRVGSLYEQAHLLHALVGASPEDEENWLLLRARLERQRDTIRALWLEVSRYENSSLPTDEQRVELLQEIHGPIQRIGAHAYEVGQAVAATGIHPESMWKASSLRTELTSILLVNNLGFPSINEAIESLRETVTGPVEVIVLSRGMEDGSDQWLANQPDMTLLGTSNLGMAAAWNMGLAHARGRTVFFCDSSAQFTPFWRDLHLEHLEQWPDVGVVASVSEQGLGSQYFDLTHETGSLSEVGRRLFASRRGQHAYVANLTGSSFMVRMGVIERVGGFDVRFGSSGVETIDWYQRIRLAGSRIRVAQDCLMGWQSLEVLDSVSKDALEELNGKWGTTKDVDSITIEQLVLTTNPFHEARQFLPYQSEDDVQNLIDREPRLLNSIKNIRKSA